MREILFRGKRTDYSEWLYGQLIIDNDKAHHIYVFKQDILGDVISGLRYVNEDTVGQYTGLKDKNGTKIFEGDVVNHTVWSQLLVANYSLKANGFVLSSLSRNSEEYSMNDTLDIEIVGNIHDNKDLLK